MKKHQIFLVVITVLIVALGYYFFPRQHSPRVISTTPTPTSRIDQFINSNPDTSLLMSGGSSYSDPEGLYTFLYPNDYVLDHQEGDTIIRISKKGATQRGQTEMYDGVIVVIQKVNLDGETLTDWIDTYLRNMSQDGTSEITQHKKAVLLNDYPGYTFQARGLGESTYLLVQHNTDSDYALNITYLVADPQNVGYQKEVDALLTTLELRK